MTRGYFINLDRSLERRARMHDQLRTLGLSRYERFAAIDGLTLPADASGMRAGERGAYLSHLGVLRAAAAANELLHVLEDDALLASELPAFASSFEGDERLGQFDIVFTDTFVQPNLMDLTALRHGFEQWRRGDRRIEVADISQSPLAGAVSYLVPPRSIGKLIEALERLRARGASLPIDLAFRVLANEGAIRVGVTVPFLSCMSLDSIAHTTIPGRPGQADDLTPLALGLLRYSFFAGRDFAHAKPFLGRLPAPRPGPSGDEHLDMMLAAVSHLLTHPSAQF